MGKIFIIIGVVYFLYYGANIIYDLFIKKDKKVEDDLSEEFTIGESNDIESRNVIIDDVENVNTPSSFSSDQLNQEISNDIITQEDNDIWRKKFEEEENMDKYLTGKRGEPIDNTISSNKPTDNSINWQNMLNMAETKVQMVSNLDGYKVYKTVN